MTFNYQNFWFFWAYAGVVHFWHQNVVFFEYMQVWWTSSPSNLHLLKKNKHFDRERHKTCIYSQKKRFLFFFAGLVTFHYENFCFFWVYAGVVHFWHQNVDFFQYMQVLCTLVKNNAFFASHACRGYAILKWTKLKLKTESVLNFLSILSYWRITIIKTRPIGCA